jgi:ketosteroid isomerase-like protein
MVLIAALLASAVAQAAPNAAGEVATPSVASDIEAIRAAGRKWAELYDQGRFAEIPELYTVDTVVMPRGRPRIEGREAMRRAIGGLAAGRQVDIAVTEREIRVVGDYGWYLGDFQVRYTPKAAGGAVQVEDGRSLIIYRRDGDGVWRVHRDIDSLAPQPTPRVVAASNAPATGARQDALPSPPVWDPNSRSVATDCDRMSASRYDRTRLAPPVAREAIDVPKAITTCEADLARLPGDPRILFQLGRLYGYAGDAAKSSAARRAAAAAGEPNAIFLLSYLDWEAAGDDSARCRAAARMKMAADRGNYSARLTYASYWLEGRLAPCADRASHADVTAYVAHATPAADGFFETRFARHLADRLAVVAGQETRKRLVDQMSGTWMGVFRRYDAAGTLTDSVPSEVQVSFDEAGQGYRQVNILRPAGKPVERIESAGTWDGDRLRFENERVTGWFGPLAGDTSGLVSVLQITTKDPKPVALSELITVSPDGCRRMRVAQYVRDGQIMRRTLINETRECTPLAK